MATSTTATFQSMLNQYLPLDLLKQELIKRDYLMSKVNHDESWKGGALQVPFQVQQASTIEYGALADVSDISNYAYARGALTSQPEAWASLQFQHKDLIQHDGKIPESTFLRILPDQIEAMMNTFKMTMSINLMGADGSMATLVPGPGASTGGTVGGVVTVDRIDRFQLSQKVILKDADTAAGTYYVTGIDINAYTLQLSATRGGAPADVSAYTISNGAKIYSPGQLTMGMTSLGSQLLSAANGGSANIFGQAKLSAPFLQCPQVDGSGITASNILSKIFDAYTIRQTMAKSGNLPEVMVSYKHFGNILKQLELSKGSFNVVAGSRKVSSYGWQTVEIGSVSGSLLKIVAIQEMPDSLIYFLDWDGITFYSNGLIRRRKSPEGLEYYTSRATTGYSYVIDHFCMGDLVVTAPWKQLVIYNVANY